MPPGAGRQHMQTFGLPHRHAGQERFVSQGANKVPYNQNLGNMEVNGTTIPTQPVNSHQYSAESQLRPPDRPGFGSGCQTAAGSGGYCMNQCWNFLQCGHRCMQHKTTPHSVTVPCLVARTLPLRRAVIMVMDKEAAGRATTDNSSHHQCMLLHKAGTQTNMGTT